MMRLRGCRLVLPLVLAQHTATSRPFIDSGAASITLPTEQAPKDFILSVAEQRDRLNDTYRAYRLFQP